MPAHQLTITPEGVMTIPEELWPELGVAGGDTVYLERDETGLHIETARERDLATVRELAGSLRQYAGPLGRTIEEIIAEEKEGFAQAIIDDYLETEERIRTRCETE